MRLHKSEGADQGSASDGKDQPVGPGTRNPWLGYGLMLLGVFVVALDLSVADVVVPSIVTNLGVSAADADLVVTIYMVVVSSFVVVLGQVSDVTGPRRAYLIAMTVFAVGSVVTAIAHNLPVLITGRTIQALAFACSVPSSMSLLNHEFRGGHSRTVAFAIWTAVLGSATAFGPLVGGALSTYVSWRWAFIIEAPLVVLSALGVRLEIRWVERLRGRRVDIGGAALLVVGLACLVFGLQQGATLGWWAPRTPTGLFGVSPIPYTMLIGCVLLGCFVLLERSREHHRRDVVLETALFRLPRFTWGLVSASSMTGALFGLLLLIPLYAQYVLGLDPLGSGLMLVPVGVGMALGGPLVARVRRGNLRKRLLILLGLQPLAILTILPLVDADSAGWWLAVPLLAEGLGWGACYSILVNTMLIDVPKELSGVASGTQLMGRFLAGAVAAAAMTAALLGIVGVEAKGLDLADLTAAQQAQLAQFYNFSGQQHAEIADPGMTLQEATELQAFDAALAVIRRDMVTGLRVAITLALLFGVGAVLSGLKMPEFTQD